MTLINPHLLLVAALLLGCSAREDTSPRLPAPPLEARLTVVELGKTQPPPAAIQVEVTPKHFRVSLDRLAPAWQQAAELRDEKIIAQGPWWCALLRERCLQQEESKGEWRRFPPLPTFPKIPLNDGEIPASIQKGGPESLYITPLLEQLRQAKRYVERFEAYRHLDRNSKETRARSPGYTLVIAADERIPMRTIFPLIYIAGQAENERLFFLVNAADSGARAVAYMMPKLAHWHVSPKFGEYEEEEVEEDPDPTFVALPNVLLRPDAIDIRLIAFDKPEETSEPINPRWAAQTLVDNLYPPPEIRCGRDDTGQFQCETLQKRESPKPNWEGATLIPRAGACKSVPLTENTVPVGEVTKLLKGFDKAEYYPGFLLVVADAPSSNIALGAWIKLLAELQAIPTFRGVYNAPFVRDDTKNTAPSCEHMIVVE